jgi:hypothetical protein
VWEMEFDGSVPCCVTVEEEKVEKWKKVAVL